MSILQYNTEELVGRFEDRRDVKNLAGKYVMSLLLKKEPTILQDLWSSREDISLGVNGGYYAGRKALEDYYASIDAATKQKAQVLKSVFPEDLGEYSDEKLYGRGPMEIRHHRGGGRRQDRQGLFLCVRPGDGHFRAGPHLQLGPGQLLLRLHPGERRLEDLARSVPGGHQHPRRQEVGRSQGH